MHVPDGESTDQIQWPFPFFISSVLIQIKATVPWSRVYSLRQKDEDAKSSRWQSHCLYLEKETKHPQI